MAKIEYSSNNSGGSWWLSDDDWKNLEAAGWEVQWVKDDEYKQKWYSGSDRWLGALATSATREGLSMEEAISEWAGITGQYADKEGCPCCGQPHDFYEVG